MIAISRFINQPVKTYSSGIGGTGPVLYGGFPVGCSFRSALGGYQSLCGVRPDLSVFGKAVANGYPLGVIGGPEAVAKSANPLLRLCTIAHNSQLEPVDDAPAKWAVSGPAVTGAFSAIGWWMGTSNMQITRMSSVAPKTSAAVVSECDQRGPITSTRSRCIAKCSATWM